MSLSGDQLWDPGQEWIQIFDNLLKHPQGVKKGCDGKQQLGSGMKQRHSSGGSSNGLFERSLLADHPVSAGSPHHPMARTRGGSVDRSTSEVRRKTSGGTVDEENFISQFSVTAGVPVILTAKMLDQEIAGVYTRLTASDWSLKVTAFQCLRGIILASTAFTDHLLERLKLLETGISDSLRDTRSAVVREAAVTIAFIAQQHQYQVEEFLCHLLPQLISLLQNNVKVISSSGVVCIRFILHHTYCARFLPLICTAVTNKSLNTRRNIFQFLEQILHVWPLHILEKGIEPIQDALKIGLLDQDRETRSWSRKTFWAFADHFKLESDLLLGCLDRAVVLGAGDRDTASVVSGSGLSVRSRQSSVARSNESLDSLVSERPFERTGSLRGKRIYGSMDYGGTSPAPGGASSTSVQRSNSLVDSAAARRALVRQQYSASCRSKVQRTGSLSRRSSDLSAASAEARRSQGHSLRSNSVAATSSRPSSILSQSSPTPRSNSVSVTSSVRSSTSPTSAMTSSMMDLANKTASLTKSTAESLGLKVKTSVDEKHVQFKQGDSTLQSSFTSRVSLRSSGRKPNGILTNGCNKNKHDTFNGWRDHKDCNQDLRIKTENGYQNTDSASKDDLKIRLRHVLNLLESSGVGSDLARLAALEPLLSDPEVVTKYPHLTAAIFSQLLTLSSGDNKEVARITSEVLASMLRSLPFVQSLTLVNNVIRTEPSRKIVIAVKNLNKLLASVDIKYIKEYTKDIMLGLLKSYDSPESAVRKASVTSLVTLHGILGEEELQPYLETLNGPKRKLLSLYILRQKQKI